MSDREFHQLLQDIGYIKGKVEKIDGIDARVLTIEKRVSRIMGWASGAGAVFGLTFALAKDWIKGVWNSHQ